jgi:hypothetical protein
MREYMSGKGEGWGIEVRVVEEGAERGQRKRDRGHVIAVGREKIAMDGRKKEKKKERRVAHGKFRRIRLSKGH